MELFKKAKDPQFWKELREKPEYKYFIDGLMEFYNRNCIGEIRAPRFSEFRLFEDTGDREAYQENFFHRQHRLYVISVLSLIYPENEDYLRLFQDTLWDICDQYVWALPAHVGKLEKNDNAFLDLDATTMSMAIAMMKVLFGDRLHPLIKSRIDAEIDRRLIKPFLEKEWFWENSNNNWQSVCAGAVGCTFMLNRPDLFPLVRDRINEAMRKYVSTYRDDGVCVEGAGYWNYGFGYFIEYADMQNQFTDGKYNLLNDEKVVNIATFMQKLYLDSKLNVNFGDCSESVALTAGFLYKLKALFPNEFLLPSREKMTMSPHYFPFMIDTFLTEGPSLFSEDKLPEEAEYCMNDTGWYVKRTKKYGFSARGGSNSESHNHNDVGSFIFSRDNKQILCDMGGRAYTKDYFINRYAYLETSSRGHNVPIVNGRYQDRIGVKNPPFAKTKYENGSFFIDFGEIYGLDELKSLVRECKCFEDGVIITDRFTLDKGCTFTERLVTFIKPKISDGTVMLDGVSIKFDKSLAKASYKTDKHVTSCNPDGSVRKFTEVYLIDLDLTSVEGGEFSFEITV